MLCSEENMELLQVQMSHKEKENTRLKEEIEEQKRSRLETERELKEEITELQEELARLHQRFRKEIENIIEEWDQYAIEFRTLQQETRERLVDPPDHLMPNLFTIFESILHYIFLWTATFSNSKRTDNNLKVVLTKININVEKDGMMLKITSHYNEEGY